MTLKILDNLIQGTPEWHDARRGLVTASVVGRLITTKTLKPANNDESRGLTALLASERITGRTESTYQNADMARGVMAEPFARDLYSTYYQQASECGFMRLDHEDGWSLGFSPDGVIADDGLLEVKAPRAKTHVTTILADAVPPYYLAQCHAGLLVSGRKWLDFCSYSSGLPLFVKRVYPDRQWFDAITAACIQFEANVASILADYEARIVDMPPTEHIDFDLVVI